MWPTCYRSEFMRFPKHIGNKNVISRGKVLASNHKFLSRYILWCCVMKFYLLPIKPCNKLKSPQPPEFIVKQILLVRSKFIEHIHPGPKLLRI